MKTKRIFKQLTKPLLFGLFITIVIGLVLMLIVEQADVVNRGYCSGNYSTAECFDKKIRKLEIEKEHMLKLKEFNDEYKK